METDWIVEIGSCRHQQLYAMVCAWNRCHCGAGGVGGIVWISEISWSFKPQRIIWVKIESFKPQRVGEKVLR